MFTTPIGFLGVGTIAAATVQGLRRQWPAQAIHLSPRSEATGRALAAADPLVTRCPSNAAVVEGCDVVVLSMLPAQLDDAVAGLPFRAGQTVVSCIAATPLADVEALVAPARACRLVPLPMIARGQGPIVLYPGLPDVEALFAPLGDLVVAPDEHAFATFVAGSAVMATTLSLQAAVTDWMTTRGADAGQASTYVRSLFRAVSETAVLTPQAEVGGLVGRHETPGGLNARVRGGLDAQGWFKAVGRALDGLAGLSRDDLKAGPET